MRSSWSYRSSRPGVMARSPVQCRRCGDARATVEIDGRPADLDGCIAGLVMALNASGLRTTASCCGHGEDRGIIIAAGSVLFVDVLGLRKQRLCVMLPEEAERLVGSFTEEQAAALVAEHERLRDERARVPA